MRARVIASSWIGVEIGIVSLLQLGWAVVDAASRLVQVLVEEKDWLMAWSRLVADVFAVVKNCSSDIEV